MTKQSEAVKKWRRAVKARIVEAMGGKCVCCGYNKCMSSLAIHHLDPSIKEISFSGVRANGISWDKIIQELRKCILVCNNCHGEIHAKIIDVPKNAASFDESFSNYKELEKQSQQNECPICGKMKHVFKITCSRQCAAKNSYKVNWDNIDLEIELKTKSVVKIAEELGCSDSAIHKRMRKLGLK